MMVSLEFHFCTCNFTNMPVIKVQRNTVKLKFDEEEKMGQYIIKCQFIAVQEELLLIFNEIL